MVEFLHPAELRPTHRLTYSRPALERFRSRLRSDGKVLVPVKYVEFGGQKFLVDGHHRVRLALELGFALVPAERVELPHGGYRCVADLFER
jgi:ParB-like chromosome segregation protein Spo0J